MQRTAKKLDKQVYIALVILIPVIVYLLSFSSIVYDTGFIEKQMAKEGLVMHSKAVNEFVITYLMDPDEERLLELDVFSEKERQHLLDVKKAVHRAFDTLFILLALFFILAYYECRKSKKKNWDKILIYSGMITVALPLALCLVPFGTLFGVFHSLLFAEGSWVFASQAALVQLYPAGFWKSIAFSFLLRGFVTGWLLIILGFLVDKL